MKPDVAVIKHKNNQHIVSLDVQMADMCSHVTPATLGLARQAHLEKACWRL